MANINTVTQAIRDCGELSCDDVAQILSTLTCKMKADGFSEVDLDVMDETRDFVCGEMKSAPVSMTEVYGFGPALQALQNLSVRGGV